MKTIALFLLFTAAVTAAEIAEVKGPNGAIYHHVRIVGIDGDRVSIIHDRGAANLPADRFDLETLARAQQEIDAKAEAAKKDAPPKPDMPSPQKAAPASVAAKPGAPKVVRAISAPPAITPAQLLAAKAAFPPLEKRRVSVLIKSHGGERADIIEVDVPPLNIWSDWKSDISTATIESIPGVIASLNAKVADERRSAAGGVPEVNFGGGSQAAIQQSRLTVDWIDGVMLPYLARFHLAPAGRK